MVTTSNIDTSFDVSFSVRPFVVRQKKRDTTKVRLKSIKQPRPDLQSVVLLKKIAGDLQRFPLLEVTKLRCFDT